jgi:hypothetical protein
MLFIQAVYSASQTPGEESVTEQTSNRKKLHKLHYKQSQGLNLN